YYDFFRSSAEAVLGKLGIAVNLPLFELILAIGLSFYSFRIISFLIDCRSGKIGKYPSLLDFSLYVSFFPQLLSGPIARAQEFLPQLENGGAKRIENMYLYVTLIISSLFKKLLVVNYLTVNITDDVFMVPQNHGSLVILLAILAYALVIYFDFSSYSDMAIGFAGLLGFRSPINFDSPYASLSIKDFWRRWHITLSNWVRDYIYIPLGGNRKGKIRQYLNLTIAMVLMGFWHGPAGHYVFWGFLQGLALAFVAVFSAVKNSISVKVGAAMGYFSRAGAFFSWLATFIFVCFSWIFFRAGSVQDGFTMIYQLFSFKRLDETFKLYVLFAIVIGFIFLIFEKRMIRIFSAFQERLPLVVWFAVVAVAATFLFRAGSDTLPAFIYFSF
ncbi:MAG: MBOAT family O-acyltransferase, partial [Candidatus Paceibacterota bacterium]